MPLNSESETKTTNGGEGSSSGISISNSVLDPYYLGGLFILFLIVIGSIYGVNKYIIH